MIKENKDEWSREQKRLAGEDKKEISKQIKLLEKDKKELEQVIELLTSIVNEAKAEMKTWEETFPIKDQWLRAEIEYHYLTKYGVDRASHHGGDLVGGGVKKLMANADTIFPKLAISLMALQKITAYPTMQGKSSMQGWNCTHIVYSSLTDSTVASM